MNAVGIDIAKGKSMITVRQPLNVVTVKIARRKRRGIEITGERKLVRPRGAGH